MSADEPGLIGYQQTMDWMGSRILTLADIWPNEVRAMIIGLNPAPKSVEAGHYYQGRYGQRQLGNLAKYGLFSSPGNSTFFEESALGSGVGFGDLVKRPTVDEHGPSNAEKEHGRTLLMNALAERDVPLVICVFRHPVEALLGSAGTLGFQSRRTEWGARVFRMPGPTAKREVTEQVMSTLHVE
jgi:TDG/mug DNA glycosylase family protein